MSTSSTLFFFGILDGDYQFINPLDGLTYDDDRKKKTSTTQTIRATSCQKKCASSRTNLSSPGTVQIKRRLFSFFRTTVTLLSGRATSGNARQLQIVIFPIDGGGMVKSKFERRIPKRDACRLLSSERRSVHDTQTRGPNRQQVFQRVRTPWRLQPDYRNC